MESFRITALLLVLSGVVGTRARVEAAEEDVPAPPPAQAQITDPKLLNGKPIVEKEKLPVKNKLPPDEPIVEKEKLPVKNKLPPDKPKIAGPKSKLAQEKLKTAIGEVGDKEASGRREINDAGTSPESAGCTGAFCTGADSLAQLAARIADGIRAAAARRRADAARQQADLLSALYRDTDAGRYSMREVGAMSGLFRDGHRPRDQEIDGLAPRVHDVAHALRTNQDQQFLMREKELEYQRVSGDAGSLRKHLGEVTRRSSSLSGGPIDRALYPNSYRGVSPPAPSYERAASLPRGRLAAAESPSGESGSSTIASQKLDEGLSSSSGALPGISELAGQPGTHGALAAPPGEKKNLPSVPDKNPGGAGGLSEENKDLLAGIMKELQDDLSGKSDMKSLDTGAGASEHALAHAPGGGGSGREPGALSQDEILASIPGAVALSSPPVPGAQPRVLASLPHADELSLFRRVSDCLRRRSAARLNSR